MYQKGGCDYKLKIKMTPILNSSQEYNLFKMTPTLIISKNRLN